MPFLDGPPDSVLKAEAKALNRSAIARKLRYFRASERKPSGAASRVGEGTRVNAGVESGSGKS